MQKQYQQAILSILRDIPLGKVASYGDIAKRAGLPGYARHVGYILKHLPDETRLPWHRVINAQGKISFPLNSPQFQLQKQKLEAEGIEVSEIGKISLRINRW